jgi:hypothetical protein
MTVTSEIAAMSQQLKEVRTLEKLQLQLLPAVK